MRRIAHLSDLNFGRRDEAVVDGLSAALKETAPDMAVIGGDFTQRARRRQFAAARDFVTALRPPSCRCWRFRAATMFRSTA
jgi:3',5'-cyclic AMP phosphodiesterase CpdA